MHYNASSMIMTLQWIISLGDVAKVHVYSCGECLNKRLPNKHFSVASVTYNHTFTCNGCSIRTADYRMSIST